MYYYTHPKALVDFWFDYFPVFPRDVLEDFDTLLLLSFPSKPSDGFLDKPENQCSTYVAIDIAAEIQEWSISFYPSLSFLDVQL